MEVIQKETRVCFKFDNNIINIPSRMYPLESDEYKVFSSENTEDITDTKIIDIFDSLEFNIGRCFTNSEKLCAALNDARHNAVQYVGWVFIGDTFPVHHSFVVVNNHILDTVTFAISKDDAFYDKIAYLPRERQYEEMSDYIIAQRAKLNHEVLVFGRVGPQCIYIGSPATAEQGIDRNKELRLVYPEHPSFQDVKNN